MDRNNSYAELLVVSKYDSRDGLMVVFSPRVHTDAGIARLVDATGISSHLFVDNPLHNLSVSLPTEVVGTSFLLRVSNSLHTCIVWISLIVIRIIRIMAFLATTQTRVPVQRI